MSEQQGFCQPKFQRVADAFYKQMARYPGGGAVSVYHRGEPVVDLWTGKRNWQGDPWQPDTLSVSFSTTKGVIATLLHQQVAAGNIDYDKPVAHYWPEFAANGKGNITVRDLLTHRAGLFRMDTLNLSFEQVLDWDTACQALAAAAPDNSSAPHSVYHALTFGWLVGEVIRRVTGTDIPTLTREALARPLGLDGLFIGTPDSEHHRVADLLMGRNPLLPPKQKQPSARGERKKSVQKRVRHALDTLIDRNILPDITRFEKATAIRGFHAQKLTTPDALRVAMPGFSGVFTARSLARLYGALANGGELDGTRTLPADMIATISKRQVFTLDRMLFTPMRWRLGYHQPFVWSLKRPEQGIGHFGFGGSGAWADPQRNLSVALTVNAGEGTPWGDARILRIGAAALKSCKG
ncbi:MAG: beta-lactamase family protein [Alcanivoracaceae bacterium]|nr:beta-lactamase family protein [Alcanivoracaceae bacterium]